MTNPAFLWLRLLLALLATAVSRADNCIGTVSCRPRCVAFQIDRQAADCDRTGQFANQPSPWRVDQFRALPCSPTLTLPPSLSLRVSEEGYTGERNSIYFDMGPNDDQFTFCSVYECPNNECEVSSQLGTRIKVEFFPMQAYQGDNNLGRIMSLDIFLTVHFSNAVIDYATRFGPLSPIWFDDPMGCRGDDVLVPDFYFPDALYIEDDPAERGSFCEEDEEVIVSDLAPAPVPALLPKAAPMGEFGPVEVAQHAALRVFFDATQMDSNVSRPLHNWFVNDNYCNYTGVVCDVENYVTFIDLNETGLSGTVPDVFGSFPRLQRLRVYNNALEGTVPSSIATLMELRQINFGLNQFQDTIPTFLADLPLLRRILFQGNEMYGTIPSELCNVTAMRSFDIAENRMMFGTIPPCFANLEHIQVFRIRDASIIGTVPQSLCDEGRMIDGLVPNLFGCDGVACPPGTIQSLLGRQHTEGTPCITCPMASNVLGSTSCRWVHSINFTAPPTPAPTAKPTEGPVLFVFPTPLPTPQPTHHPTPSPTLISTPLPTPVPSVQTTPEPETVSPTALDMPTMSPISSTTTGPSSATGPPIIGGGTTNAPSVQTTPSPLSASPPTPSPTTSTGVNAAEGSNNSEREGSSATRIWVPILIIVLLSLLLVFAVVWGRRRRREPEVEAPPLASREDMSETDRTEAAAARMSITANDIDVEERGDGVHTRFADSVDFGVDGLARNDSGVYPTDEESTRHRQLVRDPSLTFIMEARLDDESVASAQLVYIDGVSVSSDLNSSGPSTIHHTESSTVATETMCNKSTSSGTPKEALRSPSFRRSVIPDTLYDYPIQSPRQFGSNRPSTPRRLYGMRTPSSSKIMRTPSSKRGMRTPVRRHLTPASVGSRRSTPRLGIVSTASVESDASSAPGVNLSRFLEPAGLLGSHVYESSVPASDLFTESPPDLYSTKWGASESLSGVDSRTDLLGKQYDGDNFSVDSGRSTESTAMSDRSSPDTSGTSAFRYNVSWRRSDSQRYLGTPISNF